MLFADDAEELLRSLDHERFPTDSALVRRATLEDVFLRLTGQAAWRRVAMAFAEPAIRRARRPARRAAT